MKTLKTLFLLSLLALAACNGSTTVQQIPDPALSAKVDALTQALAAATHTQAQQASQLAKIQLIGPSGVSKMSALTLGVTQAIDFGPCPDAGVKVGETNNNGLDEQTQTFKQTATATCPGVYAEYDVGTGALHTVHRIYYASADCTGDAYVWDASGLGIDRQKTEAGVSFMSPNTEGQMWVAPGTQPTVILAQSVFVIEAGGCGPDGDLQPMWLAVPTNTQTSGVALSLGSDYQLNGL